MKKKTNFRVFLDMTLSRRRGGPQKNKINFLLDFDHQQREHRPWGVNNDDTTAAAIKKRSPAQSATFR